MSKLSTFVLSAAFAVTAAFSASAATLASFEITDGLWSVAGGNVITISGNYSGDATGFIAADPFAPLPLVFGASFDVNGASIFDGELGPIVASPADVVDTAFDIAFFLDIIVGEIANTGLVDLAA